MKINGETALPGTGRADERKRGFDMKNRTFRIWPLLSGIDIASYLEWMERKGLRLCRLRCFGLIGEYERREPGETRYGWDYFDPVTQDQEKEIQQYLEFCDAAGWEIVWQFERNKIFREKEGVEPPPLHTDEEIYREKVKRASRKAELQNVLLLPVFILVFGFLVAPKFAAEFPVQPLLLQLSGIGVAVLYLCSVVWNLYFALRNYFGWFGGVQAGVNPAFRGRSAVLGVLGQTALLLLWLDILVMCLEDGLPAGACGALVGLIIGSSFRRASLGLGREAQKIGMKGIPYSKPWTRPLLAAALVAVTCTLIFYRPDSGTLLSIRGNIYCRTLYKQESVHWVEPAYYEAYGTRQADRIMDYYLDYLPRGQVDIRWVRTSSDSVDPIEELSPVGPYQIPEGGELTIYRCSSESEGDTVGAGPWIVRRGNEIWVSYRYQ